jgi:hypothetical protein
MQPDRIEMSQRERDVLKVMAPVLRKERTQAEAARLLRVTDRTIRRKQRRIEAQGDRGVIHGLRGRRSNRALDEDLRQSVLDRYRKDYSPDFGPTLASEKLWERAGIAVGVTTLRRWLLEAGLWQPQRRRDTHRSHRQRRACFGELVQADGSHHDWLEGRGPTLVLLVMIDDATSKVIARFYPAETTEGYLDLLGRYVRKRGRMVELYTDYDSVFWSTDAEGQPMLTQFGRALKALGITWIGAGSPQAKGRVERFNGTAQDRLVKELRLAKACTIEQANAVLDTVFLPWFNRRCTVAPASPNDAHRPLHPSMHLASILSVQESRKVRNDYTIQWNNHVYQLLPPAYPGLRGGQVIVETHLDGTMHLRFQNHFLKYREVPLRPRWGALPPYPRSLTPRQTPARQETKRGCPDQPEQPCAVRLPLNRSGRTPAEPYPVQSAQQSTTDGPWRPPADHPWRAFCIKRKRRQPDISIGSK